MVTKFKKFINGILHNKQLILYIIVGFMTTAVSFFIFYIFYNLLGINELLSNAISWISGVIFSFFCNRKYVFEVKSNNIVQEFIKFSSGRVSTLLLDELMIFVFVTLLHFNAFIIKLISSVFVTILNYIISKYLVFKK